MSSICDRHNVLFTRRVIVHGGSFDLKCWIKLFWNSVIYLTQCLDVDNSTLIVVMKKLFPNVFAEYVIFSLFKVVCGILMSLCDLSLMPVSVMSQMPCWYYEKKDLHNTVSRRDGVDEETEARYRREGARFIMDTGTKMGLYPSRVIGHHDGPNYTVPG